MTMTPTPKEKAIELIDKFDLPTGLMSSERVQCAIIVVNEILSTIINEDFNGHLLDEIGAYDYWLDVRMEIERM